MKMVVILIILCLCLTNGLQAQPYLVTATNYASGFFGVVGDQNGQPLATGSIIHFIWDADGDGKDNPSTAPGFIGMPTGDDVLMGTCAVGVTGGAPSSGTFILPACAPAEGGWCYLRAFSAATPSLGTYYSESINQYEIPLMGDPVLYGIEFPPMMTAVLGSSPDLTVSATPDDPPVSIPPNGGTFNYTLEIRNNTQNPVPYDVWIVIILPNGVTYGPVISRTDLVMPGNGSLSRELTQTVPAGAPQGIYTYLVRTGDMETNDIIHEDGFPFEKTGTDGSEGLPENMEGWETFGWELENLATVAIPNVYFMAPPYPNPFNPTAQIQFGLPENSHVRIDVYNILGSRVTTLVDKDISAGFHNIVWHAPNVASGLYLIQMKAGGFVHTSKAFLLK